MREFMSLQTGRPHRAHGWPKLRFRLSPLVLTLVLGWLPIYGLGCNGNGNDNNNGNLPSAQYPTCDGDDLTTCEAAFCNQNGPGCCLASSPPSCFNPSASEGQSGWIGFTLCGSEPGKACVVSTGPTATPTNAGPTQPTPTATNTPTTAGGGKTQVTIINQSSADVTVYVSFYPDSMVMPPDWQRFCTGSGLNCQFPLAMHASQPLPNPNGLHLNFNVGFNNTGCNSNGTTLGEVNVNQPTWYDILDVSLVNGYNSNVEIVVTPTNGSPTTLGPPKGMTGNETVYGVYPFACDVCVARCNPPCGYSKSDPLNCSNVAGCSGCQSNGTDGCHTGSQDQPDVACQYQGSQLGGGGESVQVILVN